MRAEARARDMPEMEALLPNMNGATPQTAKRKVEERRSEISKRQCKIDEHMAATARTLKTNDTRTTTTTGGMHEREQEAMMEELTDKGKKGKKRRSTKKAGRERRMSKHKRTPKETN